MKIIVRTFHTREFEMLDLDISGKWFKLTFKNNNTTRELKN